MNSVRSSGRRYWIGVISRSHIMVGIEGGFVQLNHGKKAPLQRLHAGDWLIIYSPRNAYPEGGLLQAFTAIGTIKDDRIYQGDMGEGFLPFRRDVKFLPCNEALIKELLPDLSFIHNKQSWGSAFRFGLVEIPETDFKLIADKMGCGTAEFSIKIS